MTNDQARATVSAAISQSERQFPRAALAAMAGYVPTTDALSYNLPDDLPLPAAFRAEFKAWAAGFFEPRSLTRRGELLPHIPDGACLRLHGVKFVNPRTYADLTGA